MDFSSYQKYLLRSYAESPTGYIYFSPWLTPWRYSKYPSQPQLLDLLFTSHSWQMEHITKSPKAMRIRVLVAGFGDLIEF